VLSIAVSKGRLLDAFAELLEEAGYPCSVLQKATRKLVISSSEAGLEFILAKPADVPTYVEYGAADLGVVGKDTLLEAGKRVAELVDLMYGRCVMVVAVPEAAGIDAVTDLHFNSRVATKYPSIAQAFFQQHGIQADIIPLHGSIELGPIIGLADAVVDITETGRTLVENGLKPICEVMESTSRLIANPVSYKMKAVEIHALADALEGVLNRENC